MRFCIMKTHYAKMNFIAIVLAYLVESPFLVRSPELELPSPVCGYASHILQCTFRSLHFKYCPRSWYRLRSEERVAISTEHALLVLNAHLTSKIPKSAIALMTLTRCIFFDE